MYRTECTEENAPKFADWIKNRGGIAHWRSVDLCDPGKSWSTPALTPDGKPYPKPTWQADNEPEFTITDPSEVEVILYKEVKRFHVGIKPASRMWTFECTEAASKRIRKECDRAGEKSTYCFDYDTQEAVILIPDKSQSLEDWMKENA